MRPNGCTRVETEGTAKGLELLIISMLGIQAGLFASTHADITISKSETTCYFEFLFSQGTPVGVICNY